MKEFMPVYMLRTGELLSTDITGILVMGFRTVGFHVLCQFTGFIKLFSTL